MAKQLTLTLPDAYYAALEAKGAQIEQSAAEYLKGWVLASGLGDMPSLKLVELVNAFTKKRSEQAASPVLLLMDEEALQEGPGGE